VNTDKLERIIIAIIFLTISFTFILNPEEEVEKEVVVNEESFKDHPLVAWKSTHEKWNGDDGDIVKIKYRVTNSNTKLWIYDVATNRLVHEQYLQRDPWPDGRYRDFTYVWKLYKTERSHYIPPGEYEIRLGGLYEGGFGQLKTRIII
tara:strand:- start:413 stop:856 length:444 start_codon:yes stop_codon:yes gene_type:complete